MGVKHATKQNLSVVSEQRRSYFSLRVEQFLDAEIYIAPSSSAQSRIVYLCLPLSLSRHRGRDARVYFTGYFGAFRFHLYGVTANCDPIHWTIRHKVDEHSRPCPARRHT